MIYTFAENLFNISAGKKIGKLLKIIFHKAATVKNKTKKESENVHSPSSTLIFSWSSFYWRPIVLPLSFAPHYP